MYQMNYEYRKGILFLRISGDVNYMTADNLFQEIKKLINNNGIKNLVLNLESVYEIDSIGKVMLNKVSKIIKSKGSFYICGTNKNIGDSYKVLDNELSALNLIRI